MVDLTYILTLTHEIIHSCETLLSETDGLLDEKQRTHIQGIHEMAGDQYVDDNYPSGLLSGFNWYTAHKESSGAQELGYFVRTPLAAIRGKVYMLLRLGKKTGNLNEKQRAYIEQIQRCTDQIQDELNRIWSEAH